MHSQTVLTLICIYMQREREREHWGTAMYITPKNNLGSAIHVYFKEHLWGWALSFLISYATQGTLLFIL